MMFALLLACAPTTDDSAEPVHVVTHDTHVDNSCESLTLVVDGEDPPVVGDTWTLWMYCDEALVTGAMILQADPPDLATITDNNATFLRVGAGVMRLQVGNRQLEQAVEVGEAPAG